MNVTENYEYIDYPFPTHPPTPEDTSDTSPLLPRPVKIILLLLYITTCVLGLPGNALVIWITGFKMKQTVNTIWFLHLAIADFLYCTFLPIPIYNLVNDFNWVFGLHMCKANSFILLLNMYVSVYLLAIISFDRCVLVIFPVWSQNSRTVKKATGLVLAAWAASSLVSIPSLVFRHIVPLGNGITRCYYNYETPFNHQVVVFTRLFFSFLLPCVVILVCYGIIMWKLKTRHLAKSSKPFKIILSIIFTFFICWVPFYVAQLLEIFFCKDGERSCFIIIPVVSCVATVNSFLNPVLYVFMGSDFRDTLKQTVRSRMESAFSEQVTV
ncbi:chemerin-like receptor 1 [Amia ocellicauda]|uniref:chemerin-like receptor 1 n=1 Tax=Amia ocellicauda TaxID=2972642 RepID=UPI00346387C7